MLLNFRYVGPPDKNKKTTNSTHNSKTCKICLLQESVGLQVIEPTNPNYICIFRRVKWKIMPPTYPWKTLPPTYPNPFPLTSLPNDRIEKLITVAQRILLKIKVTKNPVYMGWSQDVHMLEQGF